MDIEILIDNYNTVFINKTKQKLRKLSVFSTEGLERLMMEHYQFSLQNTEFLSRAAEVTRGFNTNAVSRELTRNHNEESGNAVMYKAALKKVGPDVDTREEFPPTTTFLAIIGKLVEREPSAVLGTLFATETAAIFEHEVFLEISKEVIKRSNAEVAGKPLIAFHEMHLSGVEQGHKDELGIFLRGIDPEEPVANREGDRPTIYPSQVLQGAREAIDAMEAWWAALFAELERCEKAGFGSREASESLQQTVSPPAAGV